MPKSAVTAEERARVIDFTKTQVLPDANSSALIKCEKNNATRVLAAAIYSVLEKKFFDTVLPRADVGNRISLQYFPTVKSTNGNRVCLRSPSVHTKKVSYQKASRRGRRNSQQQPKLKRKQQSQAEMILCQHRVRATATHRFRIFFFKQKV